MGLVLDTSAVIELERALAVGQPRSLPWDDEIALPAIVWAEALVGARMAKSAAHEITPDPPPAHALGQIVGWLVRERSRATIRPASRTEAGGAAETSAPKEPAGQGSSPGGGAPPAQATAEPVSRG